MGKDCELCVSGWEGLLSEQMKLLTMVTQAALKTFLREREGERSNKKNVYMLCYKLLHNKAFLKC